ncbi:hypothetical protein ACIPLC_28780 [Kitasatospora sp. NPDC086801]|uniref:hypothetical protein n=1 Tax=Kitasatospora sp. NPDC086801 TaxID=3364066 RepID=UPI00381E3998
MTDLPAPAPFTTEDTLFGEITVRIDGQDRVTVSGERIPTAVLERDPGSEPDPQIAIGTRDTAHLTLTVDGSPAPPPAPPTPRSGTSSPPPSARAGSPPGCWWSKGSAPSSPEPPGRSLAGPAPLCGSGRIRWGGWFSAHEHGDSYELDLCS